jgi:phosphoesterase RecJ-like protein
LSVEYLALNVVPSSIQNSKFHIPNSNFMQQALNLIKSSKDILILTHKNPDGDAVGSVLGLAIALKSLGKNVRCFSKDTVPRTFEFLPNTVFIKSQINPKQYDLIILLDCADFSRTGMEDIKDIATSFNGLIIIDHHPRDESKRVHMGNCVEIIDYQSSSTAILIYDLLKKLNIKITKDIANCLLTGILTDTGSFQNDNTNPQSLKIAAELVKKGPRIDKIVRNVFGNRSISAIKLWGKALSRVRTDNKVGMAVSYVSKRDIEECGAEKEDLSGLVSVINTISDTKFSLLLTEYDNQKIKGSLRSDEDKGIDVSKVARNLGGGGHRFASGFEMDGDIENSIDKVSEMILKARRGN